MIIGNPMTLKSQLSVLAVGLLGIFVILRLVQTRRMNEGLFYVWLVVFAGICIVAISRRVQLLLTLVIGAYSPLSAMLFVALGFLIGASLAYSVLLSRLSSQVRDITAYIAEIRLDVDEFRDSQGSRDHSEGN